MLLVEADNALSYLRSLGRLSPGQAAQVRELSGGVSNRVLLCEFDDDSPPVVLKQARAQLRTADPWFCGVERIWREIDVLRCYQSLAPDGQTPSICFVDWSNYLFGMSAAPADARTWKELLLAGRVDPHLAHVCGRLLGQLHAGTWRRAEVARQFHDRSYFQALRLDPYYRTVARAHPKWAESFEQLAASVWHNSWCLVHADFTPKNILVSGRQVLLLDFETGHYGDPAFDLGLCLAHLLLKAAALAPRHEPLLALTEAFWTSYRDVLLTKASNREYVELVARAIQNTAGCAWARLDGKSKIDYLTDDSDRALVRGLCRWMLTTQPGDWSDVLAAWRRAIQQRQAPG